MSIETTTKVEMGFQSARAASERAEPSGAPSVLAGNQTEQKANTLAEAAQPVRAVAESETVEPKEIESAVDNMNELLEARGRQLQFQIDEETNRTVISVLDQESGDVIRQIPSEDVLKLIARMREAGSTLDGAVGVLIDSKI